MPLVKQSDTILQAVARSAGSDVFRIAYPGVLAQALNSGVLQPMYADAEGTQPITGATTDATGYYQFWVEEGTYSLEFSVNGTVLGGRDYVLFNAARQTDLEAVEEGLGQKVASADLASTATGKGAALVGFIQSGSGAVGRTAEDKARERVTIEDFGGVGDGVANDTAAVQRAVDYACANGITLVGNAGTYRITAPITYTHNFFYRGEGAWFVKDFVSTGYQDALFTNAQYNTATRTENIILRDLWLKDSGSDKFGSFLALVTGKNVLIDGLVTEKTSGSWTVPIAGDNIRICNANMHTAAGHSFGDGIHITQGENIVLDNCVIWSESDDALAIHSTPGHTVTGKFSGLDNVTVSNCVLKSATNSIRIGCEDTGLADAATFQIGSITVTGCDMPDGAQLRDERPSLSVSPIGPVKFIGCEFGDDLLVSAATGATRYGVLTLDACNFKDAASSNPIDIKNLAVQELRMSNCRVTGHVLLAASAEVSIHGCRFNTSTSGNAVAVDAPYIAVRASKLLGAGTEFRGFYFTNNGAAVPYVAVQDCRIESVGRAIATGNGIDYLDAEGTTYASISASIFSGTITNGRWSFSGSATFDPPSIAAGATTTTTVTATGAAAGDLAQASFSAIASTIALDAWVSSTNTVTVRFHNLSGGAVDLGSGTLRVRTWRS